MSDTTIKYVSWAVFVWTISLLMSALIWLFTINSSVSAKVDGYVAQEDKKQETLSAIKSDVSEIKTNIEWLKQAKK